MPLSVYNTLGLGEARPTTVTLILANKTVAYPKGKIEDVLVQVDKFIFPADFIILDFDADKDIPIILGRPFLATGRTLIDVQKGELTMRLHDQKVTFNVFNSLKYPDYLEECSMIDEIESSCYEEGVRKACKLEEEDDELEEVSVEKLGMEKEETVFEHVARCEVLENSEKENFTPSIVSPPDLELKQLPAHLKYVFLGEEDSLPVIISSALDLHQEKKLVDMLKLHIKALGWTIDDLKGISPYIHQNKSPLEDKNFTSTEPQRNVSIFDRAITRLLGLSPHINSESDTRLHTATESCLDDIMNFLQMPETDLDFMSKTFKAANLSFDTNVWKNSVKHYASPTTHDSSISVERMLLLFCLLAGLRKVNHSEDLLSNEEGEMMKTELVEKGQRKIKKEIKDVKAENIKLFVEKIRTGVMAREKAKRLKLEKRLRDVKTEKVKMEAEYRELRKASAILSTRSQPTIE